MFKIYSFSAIWRKSGNDIFHMSIVAQPRIANSNTKRKVKVTLSSFGCQLKTRVSCSKQFQVMIFWTRQSFYLISNFSGHIYVSKSNFYATFHISFGYIKSYNYPRIVRLFTCLRKKVSAEYFMVYLLLIFSTSRKVVIKNKNCNFYTSSDLGWRH